MNKNNNNFIIVIAVIIATAIGLMIYSGGQNKTSAPAVDQYGMPINELVNKPAPDFSFADRDGKIYSRDALRGKNIILFFNEGLMCYPACWNQIVALAKDERFKNTDTVVLSVVLDSPEEWQKAIAQMPELAQATVVFDKDATVSKKLGMLKTASSMHYGIFPGHTFIIIDKEGVIRYVLDDPNMGIRNDQLITELEKFK